MENSSFKSTTRNQSYTLINNILEDSRKSRQVEQGIFNSCLKYACENNIVKKWNNEIFKSLYISRIRGIYSNLKSDSYLGNINFKDKIIDGEIDPKRESE